MIMNKRIAVVLVMIIVIVCICVINRKSKIYIVFENNRMECYRINRKWKDAYYNVESCTYTYCVEENGDQYICEVDRNGKRKTILKRSDFFENREKSFSCVTRIHNSDEYLFIYENCIYKYNIENTKLTKLVYMGDKEYSTPHRQTYKYINENIIDYVDYSSEKKILNVPSYGKIVRLNYSNGTYEYLTNLEGFSFDEGRGIKYIVGITFTNGIAQYCIYKEDIYGDNYKIAEINSGENVVIYYDTKKNNLYYTDKVVGIINMVKCYNEKENRTKNVYTTLKSIQGISSI